MSSPILLIEDNASDIELMRIAFEEAGIVAGFTVFRDGDAAIAGISDISRTGPFPLLVLLDLNLPRASGHAVLEHVRSIPAFAAVPVIVMSTSNHPDDRARCMTAGANGYEVKPPRFAELLNLVERLRDVWLSPRQG